MISTVTRLLSKSAPARATCEGRDVNGRAWVVVGLRRDWLRHLLAALLLLALGALILQPLAHASPGGHSAHHAAGAMTQPCVLSGASGDGNEVSAKHCVPDEHGPGQPDCCQTCLAAAVSPETRSLPPHAGSDHRSRMSADHSGRTPPGILRPPRLTATA